MKERCVDIVGYNISINVEEEENRYYIKNNIDLKELIEIESGKRIVFMDSPVMQTLTQGTIEAHTRKCDVVASDNYFPSDESLGEVLQEVLKNIILGFCKVPTNTIFLYQILLILSSYKNEEKEEYKFQALVRYGHI